MIEKQASRVRSCTEAGLIGAGKQIISVPKLTAENGLSMRPPHAANIDNHRSVTHCKKLI